jgi:Zn finger protein HypA/HybF involved in hydrogenase expression
MPLDLDALEPEEQMTIPCPACPDGQVWTMNGPTGRTCPTCKGHAVIFPGEKRNDD